jgi:hypothetical protein
MTIDPAEIAAWREAEKRATGGEWDSKDLPWEPPELSYHAESCLASQSDRSLIVIMRNNWIRVLDELERLQGLAVKID